jgi:hypothetical protein
MRISNIVEIDATGFFKDENENWEYCINRATFRHRDDDACEFIIHLYSNNDASFNFVVREMIKAKCTEEFIEACRDARNLGAERVLFFV